MILQSPQDFRKLFLDHFTIIPHEERKKRSVSENGSGARITTDKIVLFSSHLHGKCFTKDRMIECFVGNHDSQTDNRKTQQLLVKLHGKSLRKWGRGRARERIGRPGRFNTERDGVVRRKEREGRGNFRERIERRRERESSTDVKGEMKGVGEGDGRGGEGRETGRRETWERGEPLFPPSLFSHDRAAKALDSLQFLSSSPCLTCVSGETLAH